MTILSPSCPASLLSPLQLSPFRLYLVHLYLYHLSPVPPDHPYVLSLSPVQLVKPLSLFKVNTVIVNT
jgi:hypothetical protein